MHACFPAVAVLSIVSYWCKSFYFYSMPFSFVVQEKCYQHWHVIENIVSMHLQAAQGVQGHACIVCTHTVLSVYTDKSGVAQPVFDQASGRAHFFFVSCVCVTG